ncbi:MAG: Cof-type HAD-IIB family hydrolase [Clostridia bacterium]|nr:Cof-type HAD-IIB family hydrolase [Clostridia bacterium]
MYKIAFIDLDGTLLNQYGAVEEETRKILKNIMDKGTDIVLASGRPVDAIKQIAKEIESKNYFIAGNGALIYDLQKDEIIYKETIKKEKVLEIIKICNENNIYYNIYTKNEILSSELKYNVLYYYKENQKKEEINKTKINIVQDIYKYIEEKDEEILKITVCDENKAIFDSILKRLKKVKGIEVLEVEHMSRKVIKNGTDTVEINYYYTEIMLKDTDKWKAIQYLIDKLDIQKEEIIGIGDNSNDKQMIENAGLGIVMKGSAKEIIDIGNYVTEQTNNENGVAKALEKFI